MKASHEKNTKKLSSKLTTVKFRMFSSMTVLIAAIVAMCVALNSAFAPSYYIANIKNRLADTFYKICSLYDDEALSDEKRATEIEKMCNNSNMHIMIFEDRDIVYSSLPKDSARFSDGSDERFEKKNGYRETAEKHSENNGAENDKDKNAENNKNNKFENTEHDNSEEHIKNAPPPRDSSNTFDFKNNKSILEETDTYKIMSSYVKPLDAYNIELTGDYGSNLRIVIQSSVAAISENISISNSFLIFIGIWAVLLAAVLGYFMSKRITDPIHDLSVIAKSMADMDFSKKYKGKQSDEIGLLGESINILSERLEHSIAELKNANLKLMKDIDKKEKTDKQRREFLSNVSHELKTPIAIIEAYADGLCEIEQEPEMRKEYAEVILDEAQKMSVLIKKLTSLMQLEAESGRVELERYSLTEQINGILRSKKVLANQNGVNISFEEAGDVIVWADSFLIEEALVNYIVNAIKYGSGTIRIFTENSLSNGKELVRICVFNTGSPIGSEEIELIWNSFYMADKARTRENGSSGLGLSIVKAIADAHKMQCGAYNTDDGVVFYIEVEKG